MSKAISIHSEKSPIFSVHTVIERIVLNFASLQHNSNKFYMIELQQGTSSVGDYSYRVYTEYGRIGRFPRKEGRYYNQEWEASNDFNQIVSSKDAKGYVRILEEEEKRDSFMFKTSDNYVSNVNKAFLRRMKKLYPEEETHGYIPSVDTNLENFYQSTSRESDTPLYHPIGKISAKQVEKGLDILHRIEMQLQAKANSNFEYLSNQFYSLIPVSFGSRVDTSKYLINDYDKLNEKKELLREMHSS